MKTVQELQNNKTKVIILTLIAILASGLLLRSIFFMSGVKNFTLLGDAKNYYLMSHQLVDKGIYGYWYEGIKYGGSSGISNARVSPGYPLFLSSVYFIFHDKFLQITIIRLLQVIIGGLISPLLAFLFVKRITKDSWAALLTTFLVAVYPTYVKSVTLLLTEVVALATMLLYFYFMTIALEKRKIWLAIIAGLAFAMQIHIRPVMLPLFPIPFVFAWFAWDKNQRKTIIQLFIATLSGFVILMLPWWIRNYLVLGKVIITATGSGNPLLAGTYPYMKDFMRDVPENIKGVSNLQAAFAKERIIKGFTTEPILYFKWYTFGKLEYLFSRPWFLGKGSIIDILHLLMHRSIVLLGVIGIAYNSVKNRLFRYVNIYFIVFTGLYLIFIPENRYAYQVAFFLMLSTSCLMVSLISYLKTISIRVSKL